jgi:hypothetical protein
MRADHPTPPDLPLEVRPDPDAAPGNFIPPLARLLLAMARRELAERASGDAAGAGRNGKEVTGKCEVDG